MNAKNLHCLILGLSALLAGLSPRAYGLTWEKQTIEATAEPGQKDVKAVFPFHNASDRSVTITTIDANCSCTTALTRRMTYAPREGGQIEVVFEIGNRAGLRKELVTVATDEYDTPPASLILQVQLPTPPATATAAPPATSHTLQAGGVEWENPAVDLTAEFDQLQVQTAFTFRNTSQRVVTITSVEPGCSCTTTALAKKSYAPGEAGQIGVIFDVGDRTGLQEKFITVSTDEPGTEPVSLALRVTIREYLSVEPRVVYWGRGAPATEQTITCRALQKPNLVVTEARAAHPLFSTQIEVVEPGRLYRIHVKPSATVEPLSAVIALQVALDGARPRSFSALAYIKQK